MRILFLREFKVEFFTFFIDEKVTDILTFCKFFY